MHRKLSPEMVAQVDQAGHINPEVEGVIGVFRISNGIALDVFQPGRHTDLCAEAPPAGNKPLSAKETRSANYQGSIVGLALAQQDFGLALKDGKMINIHRAIFPAEEQICSVIKTPPITHLLSLKAQSDVIPLRSAGQSALEKGVGNHSFRVLIIVIFSGWGKHSSQGPLVGALFFLLHLAQPVLVNQDSASVRIQRDKSSNTYFVAIQAEVRFFRGFGLGLQNGGQAKHGYNGQ